MQYWKMFSDKTVIVTLGADDQDGVLDELQKTLAKALSLGPAVRKSIRESIGAKVGQGATGAIGHGVAVPHVKVKGVKETAAVFARSREGIEFGAGDGVPVKLFFFVVGPPEAPEEHLDFMRWIATIARNGDFRRFASGCTSKKEMLDLLKEMGES